MTQKSIACVADEQNPGYIRLRIRAQKLVPAPRALPGISIITFDWLLNRAVLSCAAIGHNQGYNRGFVRLQRRLRNPPLTTGMENLTLRVAGNCRGSQGNSRGSRVITESCESGEIDA